jgi:hypothetical protein
MNVGIASQFEKNPSEETAKAFAGSRLYRSHGGVSKQQLR